MNFTPRHIELLAPAKDLETAKVAIDHGADAVYIGAHSHGARVAAGNSLEDISEAVIYAHRFGARVYCTINTLVYDDEIGRVEQLIRDLYRINVDALIVQDMGILKMDIPPIALHASTQCDIRDVDKAKFLSNAGFSQLVLARELSLDEIAEIHSSVDVPLEVFVHGALCVSYSGDCQASMVLKGRSANRGECAQICRLPYDLVDSTGRFIPVKQGKHLLSLKDMNRLDYLDRLLDAGVSSFKIEGRLKDISYVKNVVAAYRKAIDELIKTSSGRYVRSSFGGVSTSFTPDLNKSFNRGYTDYFLNGKCDAKSLSSMASPKSIGSVVGTVTSSDNIRIKAKLSDELNNGDGLGFYASDGVFTGFRLNRIVGNELYPASKVLPPTGTQLYRNRDKAWDDSLRGVTSSRKILVNVKLWWATDNIVAATAVILENGLSIGVSIGVNRQKSNNPQEDTRARNIAKLGGTSYSLSGFTDLLGDSFVPASKLSELRRAIVTALDRTIRINHSFVYKSSIKLTKGELDARKLTYHDNVSNQLAERFYADYGASVDSKAIELAVPSGASEIKVMTSRYCLRRELGCCLKKENARLLPGELFLVNGQHKLRLKFDCANCEMQVWFSPKCHKCH